MQCLTYLKLRSSFNTQPPEGGCNLHQMPAPRQGRFQHTAARRRLQKPLEGFEASERVSTHSRPKAAAKLHHRGRFDKNVSTHSRPKAAASKNWRITGELIVSTHSRPKAAANKSGHRQKRTPGFNTQPPEGGCQKNMSR